MLSIADNQTIASLFRDDGTPIGVAFDRTARDIKPPAITIDLRQNKGPRFQRRVSVPGREVRLAWQEVFDLWFPQTGYTQNSKIGKEISARFFASLPAFLSRYEVETAHEWIFTEK